MKIVQNKKRVDTVTDDDDDNDDDDKEMPEETGTLKVYDTEKDGRYVPIRPKLDEDALQIHMDGEMLGEKLEGQIRGSNRNSEKSNKYGGIPDPGNFGG